GQSVGTTTPSYYAVTVSRGLNVKLVRVVNGVESTLATVKSVEYLSGVWVQASLVAKGQELRVQIFRADTGQYLNPDGTWGLAPAPGTVPPPTTSPGLPTVPRHYSWVRLANLAYYGTPLDAFALSLLKSSVDLVIPNYAYLGDVARVAPATPQLVYTNVSNVY